MVATPARFCLRTMREPQTISVVWLAEEKDEGGRQKAESRKQRAESGEQRKFLLPTAYCLLPTVFRRISARTRPARCRIVDFRLRASALLAKSQWTFTRSSVFACNFAGGHTSFDVVCARGP